MEYALRRKSRKSDMKLSAFFVVAPGGLSIVEPDETPYGVPLNYVLQERERRNISSSTAPVKGARFDYLRLRPQAAFVAVEEAEVLPDKFSTAYGSSMVSGRIERVDDPETKRGFIKIFRAKNSNRYNNKSNHDSA